MMLKDSISIGNIRIYGVFGLDDPEHNPDQVLSEPPPFMFRVRPGSSVVLVPPGVGPDQIDEK
jgi:hypothetical protein